MGDLLGSPRVASLFFAVRHVWALHIYFRVPRGRFFAGVKNGDSQGKQDHCVGMRMRWRGKRKYLRRAQNVGCNHTSTKAPDPIRTPKLRVLGRE